MGRLKNGKLHYIKNFFCKPRSLSGKDSRTGKKSRACSYNNFVASTSFTLLSKGSVGNVSKI